MICDLISPTLTNLRFVFVCLVFFFFSLAHHSTVYQGLNLFKYILVPIVGAHLQGFVC